MVLIIFGLVVPMSVLTQLLTATLWKAFCFLSKIPGLKLPVVNSHKLRVALSGVRNKSSTSAFSFFSSRFHFVLHSSPRTHGRSVCALSCSLLVILALSALLSCWGLGVKMACFAQWNWKGRWCRSVLWTGRKRTVSLMICHGIKSPDWINLTIH